MSAGGTKHKFAELDALRFLFASVVMLGHLTFNGSWGLYDYIPQWELSVDFFFVLSGFVLTHSLQERPQSYREFAISRFARLLPLHWFSLLLLTAGLVWFGRAQHLTVGGFFWNFFLLHTIVFEEGNFNWPSWSIAVEFWLNVSFFYFVAARRMFGLALLIFVASLALYVLTRNGIVWWLQNSITRGALCLTLGFFCYELYGSRSFAELRIGRCVQNIGVACIAACLLFVFLTPYSITSYFFGIALMPLLILLIAGRDNDFARVFRHKPLPYLGSLSFSIYLLHYPISLISNAAGLIDHPITWLQLAASILVVLACSAFTYPYLEVPARRYIVRALHSHFGGRDGLSRGTASVPPRITEALQPAAPSSACSGQPMDAHGAAMGS
jgi:peptidoglycan/LPS O-acetylase OafA/YrhL